MGCKSRLKNGRKKKMAAPWKRKLKGEEDTKPHTKIEEPGDTCNTNFRCKPYIMISQQHLQGAITIAAVCSSCREGTLVLLEDKREGWAHQMRLKCMNCDSSFPFWTSPDVKGEGRQPKEINRALVLGTRAVGIGYSKAATLSGYLNLPPPVHHNSWANHTRVLADNLSGMSDSFRKDAATRLRAYLKQEQLNEAEDEDIMDVAVSFDGSWKNRGFKSHHCIVAAISMDTCEVLDIEYLCNYCRQCQLHAADDQSTLEHLDWIIEHTPNCPKNFNGSAQGMESEGIRRLYERSLEMKLRYTTFIGDGDSKSYNLICKLDPYSGVQVEKEECVGHIRKRMGTRLRRLLNKMSGNTLSDKKPLGGKGRLTHLKIDAFQYFYGECLISNKGDPETASKEVMASLYHYAQEGDHTNCSSRWCNRKEDESIPPDALPPAVVEAIKPIFEDLSNVELLKHCSRCLTQNSNESLNACVWRHVPKEGFNSVTEISLAVEMARLYFNLGRFNANLITYAAAGLEPSREAMSCFSKIDHNRIYDTLQKTTEKAKVRRLQLKKSKRRLGFNPDSNHYKSDSFNSGSSKRSVPHCRKCKKPRKGHTKKYGCPK